MNREERIAFIQAQSVCALAEIEGMKAENMDRESRGLAPAYGEKEFGDIQSRFMIGHNAIIEFFGEY